MAAGLTRPTPVHQDAPFRRQGHSERSGESHSVPYVEPLSDARTPLADVFSILLGSKTKRPCFLQKQGLFVRTASDATCPSLRTSS